MNLGTAGIYRLRDQKSIVKPQAGYALSRVSREHPPSFLGFSDSKTSRPGASFHSVFLLSYALLSTRILFVLLFKELCRRITDHSDDPTW